METNYHEYFIEPDGRVFSLRRYRYLKPSPQMMLNKKTLQYEPSGYMIQTLVIDGKSKRIPIHRLVAMVYIENPESKPWVNHKDGNKSNNHVDNLEWTTISENHKHAYDVLGKIAKGWTFNRDDSYKKKLSETKKGTKHPKFKGYYVFIDLNTGLSTRAATPHELKRLTGLPFTPMTLYRRCMKNSANFQFVPVSK